MTLRFPVAHQTAALSSLLGMAAMALLLWSAVPLTQSDGDLFAHIALGREILERGLRPVVSPAWGSAVLFAWLHDTGGLPGIACAVAVMAGVAHALGTHLLLQLRVPPTAALLAAVVTVTLAASHWLARPHAVTLLFMAVLMHLLHAPGARTVYAVIPLFGLWANLHGGWAFGAMVLLCHTVGEIFTSPPQHMPRQRVTLVVAAGLALASTLATPYGIGLHHAILRTLRDGALAATVTEYQPPSWSSPVDALFLLIVLAALPTLLASRRQLPVSTVLIVLLSIGVSLKASRNISLFAFTGWPLLAAQAATCITRRPVESALGHTKTRVTAWRSWLPGIAGALGVLLLGARGGVVGDRRVLDVPVDSRRFPVAAVEALQRMPSADHTLTTWAWSGYLPYAWRHHRAVFDPLRFTPEEMQQLGTLLTVRTGWRALLDSTAIGTVLVPRHSPLDKALSGDAGWDCWYRDETASVFRRRASPGYL